MPNYRFALPVAGTVNVPCSNVSTRTPSLASLLLYVEGASEAVRARSAQAPRAFQKLVRSDLSYESLTNAILLKEAPPSYESLASAIRSKET